MWSCSFCNGKYSFPYLPINIAHFGNILFDRKSRLQAFVMQSFHLWNHYNDSKNIGGYSESPPIF